MGFYNIFLHYIACLAALYNAFLFYLFFFVMALSLVKLLVDLIELDKKTHDVYSKFDTSLFYKSVIQGNSYHLIHLIYDFIYVQTILCYQFPQLAAKFFSLCSLL